MRAHQVTSALSLCSSIDCSPPGSSVHGILQARILERIAISFSSDKVRSEWSEVSIFYLERQTWAQMKAKQHVTLEKKQLCSEEKLTILRVSGIKSMPAKHVTLERCKFILAKGKWDITSQGNILNKITKCMLQFMIWGKWSFDATFCMFREWQQIQFREKKWRTF